MSWALEHVDLEHVASSLPRDSAVEALVDDVWSRQRADAAARGHLLVDGPAYRLESYDVRRDRLVLGLALVDYRRHSALKEVHGAVSREHHDRALVVDALVTTADDHVVLLRTDKPVGVELQLVGGTATPGQREVEDAADLARFAAERVGRALPDCGPVEVRCVLGVLEQEIGCRNLVLDVHLPATSGALRPQQGSELVLVPAAGLASYLRDAPGYLPAVADLL